MPLLFKDAPDLMRQGLDYSRRGQFDRASESFDQASAKYSKQGQIQDAGIATAYSRFMRLGSGHIDPQALRELGNLLRSFGFVDFSPGARSIRASSLAYQLELDASERETEYAFQRGAISGEDRSQRLKALAEAYRSLGEEVLYCPEFFEHRAIPASRQVPILSARSEEALGEWLQSKDPLTAAEHFSAAQQWWTQAGDGERAAGAADRVGRLAFRAKCWFCGREGSGHGIQFVSMPIDYDVSGFKADGASPLPSVDGSGRYVFACKGCHSAIRLEADAMAARRVDEMERRLMARIQDLEARISSLPR